MARFPLAMMTAIAAFSLLALAPRSASAQSASILDRVKERAQSRAQSQTENKANEQVDSTVDKTVDCMFNPVECAKKTPAAAPAPGEVAPTPVADTTEWYAENQGKRLGPMPRDQLATLVTSGQVTQTTLVWREGMGEWTPAGQVSELGDVFKKVPPPLPTRSGPPPLPIK